MDYKKKDENKGKDTGKDRNGHHCLPGSRFLEKFQ
jgi:hypothetical protein